MDGPSSFNENIESWWKSLPAVGWPSYAFMNKLKEIKFLLKNWNKETFGVVEMLR